MDEKYFCRCCLSEDCYKDMANDYYFGKVTENYLEMLLNVFNIDITNNDGQRSLICEECVSKLRDAAAYKTRVLRVQEMIRENLHLVANGKGTNINKMLEEADNLNEYVNDNDYSFNENDIKWENFTSDASQKGKRFTIHLDSNRQKSSIDSQTFTFKPVLLKNEFKQQISHKSFFPDTNYPSKSNTPIEENSTKNSTKIEAIGVATKKKINIDLQESINTSNDNIENVGASDFENSDCQEDNLDVYAKPLSSCIEEDLDIGESSKSRKRNLKNTSDTGNF
uniref:ZAD domain-containing protein n=1 Tax=Heliothis virescens TaxID=7102 RepID=A0A2A4JKG4_HELVI